MYPCYNSTFLMRLITFTLLTTQTSRILVLQIPLSDVTESNPCWPLSISLAIYSLLRLVVVAVASVLAVISIIIIVLPLLVVITLNRLIIMTLVMMKSY